MKGYISGTAAITPQHTFDADNYLTNWVEHQAWYLQATEPEYRELIEPRLLRRMSRIIKMSVACAFKAMKDAEISAPGAVIVGTGLGCIQDTEKFLKEIVDNEEGILSPTAFIQSTHNTIAGQIALLLQCPNHNFTFSNRGHSFENALEDALLQLHEGVDHVLVGGADEVTPLVHQVMAGMGCIRDTSIDHLPTLGEGAAYFVLTNHLSKHTFARIEDSSTFNSPVVTDVNGIVQQFLDRNQLKPEEIDVLLIGSNANIEDAYYNEVTDLFNKSVIASFKNISGESFTASAYAHHLAASMLKQQQVFHNTLISGNFEKPLNRILIYNHYKGFNHTLALLSKCPT